MVDSSMVRRPEQLSSGFVDAYRARREEKQLVRSVRREIQASAVREERDVLRHAELVGQQERDHQLRMRKLMQITDRAKLAAELAVSAHDHFAMLSDGNPAKARILAPFANTLTQTLTGEIP